MDSETDNTRDADALGIVADIAALARKLAATDPYRSMNGPEALQALASYLDQMAAPPEPDPGDVVSVAVRGRLKPSH
jgi:hypothetical protein